MTLNFCHFFFDQIRYGKFKNHGPEFWKSSEESEEEEKTKNARIATKIGIKIKFGTVNSKIMVPRTKNQKVDHVHAPPLENLNVIGSI